LCAKWSVSGNWHRGDNWAHLVANHREISKEAIAFLNKVSEFEKKMVASKSKEAGKILDKMRQLRPVIEDGLHKAESLGVVKDQVDD
jgi:hypothetical protein